MGSKKSIRVAWIGGEPTPTRIPHLQALAARPEIDLSVVYAARTFQHRTWSIQHPEASFLRGWSLPTTRILHHNYPITLGIWRFLQRGAFDIVVIAGWAVFASQSAIVWCQRNGVPYVLNAENHFREPRPGWVKLVKRLVLPHVIPQAAGILVSGSLAREHALFYGARPDRVVVFPNTPDVPKLVATANGMQSERSRTREQLGIGPAEVVVLQVGRLIPVKGADVLVSAVARAQSMSSTPLRLVLTGEGPEQSRLEALAARLGVRLTTTGQLEGDDLIAVYIAADVFALLSRRETWGIVVNEAMACGLPLVLSRAVGAADDLLEPGRNGILVESGDVEESAAALARLVDDTGLRAEFGMRSRAIIGAWGFERSLDDFCSLANVIVGRSPTYGVR